jgi:hypothetical protein
VSLVVHDVAGRTVRRLIDGVQPAGDHEVRLDAQGLPSGVYFYRLEYAGKREQKQCILVR